MANQHATTDMSPDFDTAEATAFFSSSSFRRGHRAVTEGDRPGETMYIPSPHFREKVDIRGRYGPECGFHLPRDTGTAAIIANELSCYVNGSDLRFYLNVVDARISGPVTRAAVLRPRGIAAQISYYPDISDPQHDRAPWTLCHFRINPANVKFMYFLGYCQNECWAYLPFTAADDLLGDAEWQRHYCDATYRFADAIGGKAAPDPLLTTLPLFGACRVAGGSVMSNRCVLPIDVGVSDRPSPRHLEDMVAAVSRIEAAPPTP